MKELYVKGMHGMGDNIHQRAVMRAWLEKYDRIFLETSWPAIYQDMPRVLPIFKRTSLRTQTKNAGREYANFYSGKITHYPRAQVAYNPEEVKRYGSVLKAMLATCNLPINKTDFSMRVPASWIESMREKINTDKPVIVYRPLVERKEWGGCARRNPDEKIYYELFESLRKDCFVVSVADIVPNVEWITSKPINADLEFHAGELNFENLAGLYSLSDLVYCSPGFSVPLSRAVGADVICVFGAYESSRSFTVGGGRYLGIDLDKPCEHFSHNCNCSKHIDIDRAKRQIGEFLNAA